nr:hypothetical protein [Human betaherpesvirus 6]ARM07939.2 hypothetical protein [Human betaherpesvirus 6]QFW55143.1 hypothetical protein [Human betaherpesvirus 6]QFW55145.1 hypothetical protein [Human betaherpesvirus 6]QFW57076.1 hypothetical protein [Human betaherpesvirus 6]
MRKTGTAVAPLADFRVLVSLGRKDPNRSTH